MRIEGVPWNISEKITRNEEGCWICEGQKTAYGYPKYNAGNRKTAYVHVLVWETVTGREKGKDFSLRRTCAEPMCVNPDHMELFPRTYRPLRTHCKRGHELTEDNVYRMSCGKRECRTCVRERQRGYKESKK